jgi:hypothetical protein
MATLILEIQRRLLHEYVRIERFPFTIGRALDNDLILSDPTVSPHHLLINRNYEGKLVLQNLSDENGTRLGRKKMGLQAMEAETPSRLQMGRVRARLLPSDHSIEETRILGCRNGHFCFFHSRFWAVLMPLLAVGVMMLDKLFNTFTVQTMDWYAGDALETLVILLIMTGIVSALNRLTIHRWEYTSAWTLSCLIFLSIYLLSPLAGLLNYLVSNSSPELLLDLAWIMLFLPAILFLYFRKSNHAPRRQALMMTLILCVIPIVLELKDLTTEILLGPVFSGQPEISSELSHLNWHAGPVISLGEFMQQAQSFEAGETVP